MLFRSEIWANQTVMFDLTEEGLSYYELKVIRGKKPQVIEAKHEVLDEGFSLSVLESPMGEKMAPFILYSARRSFLK